MQQSPSWETNRSSATQEIPCISWKLRVHYRVHKSLLPVPILSQNVPYHSAPSHFSEIHFNIILPSTPGPSKWPPFFNFTNQNPVHTSPRPLTCYMPCPSVFFISSSEWYLVRRTEHKAPRYVVIPLSYIYYVCFVGRDSSVGIATSYELDGPGIESWWGEIFRTRPDQPWGTPSLVSNGHRVSFPGIKRPGRGFNHPPPSSAEVKEKVDLYLYSPSGPPVWL